MTWNPNVYNQFKSERAAPFFDLAALVTPKPEMEVLDLGCGTGELTRQLADEWQDAHILGIDASAQMLENSKKFENARLKFEIKAIETQLQEAKKWDLIFSNAAIQWCDHHENLLPLMISKLKTQGQLALQMPAQNHNITNILLDEMADDEDFTASLNDYKRGSSVLDTAQYAQLLFAHGAQNITVFEKIYPLVLPNVLALYDWVSGTALIPFMQRLSPSLQIVFTQKYLQKLKQYFPDEPVFYPFKRIFIAANF